MYAFKPLKFRSYWTKVHQILHDVASIATEAFEIGIATFHSVLECQGEYADFADFHPKNYCYGNIPSLSDRKMTVRSVIYD